MSDKGPSSAEREQLHLRGPRRLHPDVPLTSGERDPMAFLSHPDTDTAKETRHNTAEMTQAALSLLKGD